MTTTQNSSIQSKPPKVMIDKGNPEAIKYGRMWEFPEYRKASPGEGFAPMFLQVVKPRAGASVIDFGCGTGRGAMKLAQSANLHVTLIDFVNNSLDPQIRDACDSGLMKFIKADLERPLSVVAEYGYCTDVMEHIPQMRVDRVLENILDAAQHVFFAICMTEDSCGDLIGEPLHMSVHDYGWWLQRLAAHDCEVRWSERAENYCFFYVTSWKTGRDVVKSGKLNVEEEQIKKNVQHNIAQGWEQVREHPVNDFEVMILGGGPSLATFEDDIKARRRDGAKLVTLNGAYNWAIDHGLTPSAQMVVDARPFNARFTKPVVDGCRYLIASQCDPAVFAELPKDRTWIWHSNPALIGNLLSEQYDATLTIPGGSSILLRAIPLLRLLGYRKFHLYGCDSCVMNGAHHAFSQPENDGGVALPVIVSPSGKIFYCHPWMSSQAHEFMDLIKFMGDEFEVEIYGDGLLAHILKTGAEIQIEGVQ